MAGKAERFIMRLDGGMLEQWKARAAIASTSIAALIIAAMEGQAPGPTVEDLSQATQQAILAKDQEMAALKKALATAKAVRPAKAGAVPVLHRQIKGLEATVDAQAKHIAKLEGAIASGPRPPPISDPHKPRPVVRHHPAGPVLADPVPAAAGQAIGFNLKGQTKGKVKP